MNDLGAVNRKMSMFAGSRKNGLQRKLLEGGMRNGNKDARKKGYKHKHNPSCAGLRMFSRGLGLTPKDRHLTHFSEKPVYCHLGRDRYGNKIEAIPPKENWHLNWVHRKAQ